MAFYTAFWHKAFWNKAYQIAHQATTTVPSSGGWGNAYKVYSEQQRQREKIRKSQAELKRVEQELAESNRLLAEDKANREAADHAVFEAKLQEEISRLRNERDWLIRRIDEDEAILVLLLVAKRRRLNFAPIH